MGLIGSSIVRLLPLAPRFVVRWVANRYVAGETLDHALSVIREIDSQGACFTVDVLGEEISSLDETHFFIREYEAVLDAIADHNIDANISIKPTAFGLLVDLGAALDNIEGIIRKASEHDIFVRLDMEDSRVTQATIDVLHSMHERGLSNVGVAIQGRLHRTLDDISTITASLGPDADLRVCKGIYLEPSDISQTDYKSIVKATNDAIDAAIEGGAYVAIASHDDPVIEHSLQSVSSAGMGPGIDDPRPNAPTRGAGKGPGYEFQFLLGVRGDVRRSLAKKGHRTRVYLPYGVRWYEYSMRRLRENPEVAIHITKALLLPWKNRR
ncbi:MAG: proline dehydrogenase family protein [Candidatus Thalassarchaeaceae archaeon]|jgi:proline dehydrogenase|nr:proline dehydrogenase family protein [Candidatus Thalassarchaeaceae archaeon]MDP7257646.1 proline dehydrogenase family protein [Candidatus Thalassarchaeaceae archaeon]MDP7446422.1 proline dehydrogenase family protein [Candidatus Thalassarchaeaceae archaeon]MDP7649767.1 proline dehydrogenase family protein [Candidatus Thalassarchaeaceae archaeon]HJL54876.1 proline dehydrogenase family protein [Candidatus Thalassarchaeaceae archaeon]|tara:strand:+ start:7008 stop:7982 length:975 start_codon:yes stop_codon:yes gene_type:complete